MGGARVGEGSPLLLGGTPDGRGVNFAIFAGHATAVDLCLFGDDGCRETDRIPLPVETDGIWHGHVSGIGPGQLYGFRVHGPYRPEHGHRFNPNKLLVDPYARALAGRLHYDDSIYGFVRGSPRGDLSYDERDSAAFVPKSVVTETARDGGDHRRPRRAWSETVIYEAHVRGLSRLHPDIPEVLQGTYEALGHPAIIGHFERLGVTAIELLPLHAIADEPAVVSHGLVNYWGYSTLNFFAPEARYLGPSGPAGLKSAVRALHEAGIEVILDVVYNHTAEGEEDGPTLSFRGLDNASYYKHRPDDPGRLWDSTGCGNTLNVSHPQVAKLVLDSMRYWADEFGVDGFRLDLATSVARDPYAFNASAPVLQTIAADPVLSSLKLIAEPWDAGDGGYQLGAFPVGWSEWNDRHRDTVRAFWRGDPGQVARLAQGLAGSKEIFEASGRGPSASINYVTSHDGFTLRDLVSYEVKHNEANGEGNRDGHGHNLSSNGGHEGDIDDPAILAMRARQVRNMLATIVLSQGVPMLLAGDEAARSQGGNNNPYCQDNPTSWIGWAAGEAHDPELARYVAHLLDLRRRHGALRRRDFLTGVASRETGMRDVTWLSPRGHEMRDADWGDGDLRAFGMELGGDGSKAAPLLLLLSASPEPVAFRLPDERTHADWRPVLDTRLAEGRVPDSADRLEAGGTFVLAPRSLVLFHHAI